VSSVPAHTVKNLKQVEDGAVKFGLSPALEARFARADLDCEQVGLSYQRLAPGARHPVFHRHDADEEIYVITAGGGVVSLDGEEIEIGPWDAIRVAPETARGFIAGPDGLELIAFGTHRPGDGQVIPPDEPPAA
jgi:uncharacterized cupin superfamily protein